MGPLLEGPSQHSLQSAPFQALVLEPKWQVWVFLIDGDSPGTSRRLSELGLSCLGLEMEVEKVEEVRLNVSFSRLSLV